MAKITQRLIAAGASPERAAAFEKQFIAARPGLKPQDIQDAFDSELGAYAAAQFPNMWRPKSLDDAQLVDYYIGIKGQQRYDDLTKNTYSRLAPNYNKSKQSSNLAIQTIVQDVEDGVPLADAIAGVRAAWKDAANRIAVFGTLTQEDAIKEVNTIYREYNAASTAASGIAKSELGKDKYFQANLPDPKLKYGLKTDLKAGTIDFKTNPKVVKVLEKIKSEIAKEGSPYGPSPRGIKLANKYNNDAIFKSFQTTKTSPFFAEVQIRENLKDKTTLP